MLANLYATIGDQGHTMCILSTVVFLFMVVQSIRQNANESSIFDSTWKQTGFCVTNQEVPYWSSHDVCFYVDVAFALVSVGIYYALRKTPGMESANKEFVANIPAMLFHGIGHGLIARSAQELVGRDTSTITTNLDTIRQLSPAMAVGNFFLGPLFWYFMLKGSMPNVKFEWLCFSALLAFTAGQFLPVQMNFTYVQTVLFLAFSVDHLLRPVTNKDFSYMLHPILVSLPLSLVGWMESTMCESFVKDKLYGHVAYDAFIPVSTLVWYGLCYMHATEKKDIKKVI